VLSPALGVTRAAQEATASNATLLGDYQSLNVRVDYRRRVFGTAPVLVLDVINVYGADRGSPLTLRALCNRVPPWLPGNWRRS